MIRRKKEFWSTWHMTYGIAAVPTLVATSVWGLKLLVYGALSY